MKKIMLLCFCMLLLFVVTFFIVGAQDKNTVFQERTAFDNVNKFAKTTSEVHEIIDKMIKQDFIQISIRPYISFKQDTNMYKYEINIIRREKKK